MTSSIVAALLAVGLVTGFVLLRTGQTTPSGRAAPTTSMPAPSTSLPVVPTGPSIVPGTTAPRTTGAPAPAPTITVAPTTCTRGDMAVTTTVSGSSNSVAVLTELRAVRPCIYQPVSAGPYGCPSWIVVTDSAGRQVWPGPSQGEQCSSPSSGVLEPGVTETLRTTLTPPGSGRYVAVGTWAWSSGGGPDEVSGSEAFGV